MHVLLIFKVNSPVSAFTQHFSPSQYIATVAGTKQYASSYCKLGYSIR